MVKIYTKRTLQLGVSLLLVLINFSSGFSQQTAIIGAGSSTGTASNGATGDPGPIYRSGATSAFIYSRHHYLYTQAELAAAGILPGMRITMLSWNKTNAEAFNSPAQFEIWIKNSSLTTVQTPPQTWSTLTTGSTQVYNSPTTLLAPTGYVDFSFSAPFIYTGDALEISVAYDHSAGSSPWSTLGLSWAKDPISGRTISYCGNAASTSLGNARTVRPQIKFTCSYASTPNNAGISGLVAPKNFCSGNHDIKVRLKNNGNAVLNNVTIKWVLNSVPQTPINWTAPLDTFGGTAYPNDTVVTLGNLFFTNTVNTLSAWTELPNGVTDTVNTDDTLNTSLRASLSGSFTIGGSTPDYPNIISAIADLKSFGVCGPVTLHVAPNSGPYTGNLDFSGISGLSSANTLTVLGNGNTVNSAAGPIVSFSGVSYITLDSFNLVGTGAFATYGIFVTGSSHHITITKNNINVGTSSTAAANAGIVVGSSPTAPTTAGNGGQYLTITGNEVTGGYYGLVMVGNTGYLNNHNHIIQNNVIKEFYYYGMYLADADSVTLSGNSISRPARTSVSTTTYGIYLATSRYIKVNKNRIFQLGGSTVYGIGLSNCVSSPGYEIMVSNNLIYNLGNTSTLYGIYSLTTALTGARFYHNTIQVASTGNTGAIRGAFFNVTTNNVDIKNNIVSISGAGTGAKHCVYITSVAVGAGITSNNNVLHMNSSAGTNNLGYLGANIATLPAWQAATLQDANSVATDPVFSNAGSGNLMPLSSNIDNLGVSVGGITTDILGVTRSALTPDLGAYEFTGVSGDIGLASGRLSRSSACYNTNDSVFITLTNLIGSTVDFTVNPLNIAWSVTGPVNSNGTIQVTTGTLPIGSNLTLFANNVQMSQPGVYTLHAYIEPNTVNTSALNDTLSPSVNFTVQSILSVAQKNFTATSPTDSFAIQAVSPLFPGGNIFFSEVCHWRGATNAAPVPGGWPAYMIADDYVEISGVPNSDLAGYILEEWTGTSLQHTYTFPANTLFSPAGTMIIATGQLGASIPSPANFYYHSGNTVTHSSTGDLRGYVIKSSGGAVVDAVTYGAYTFPAASNVTASDWSGSTPALSSAGNKLIAADNNTASVWAVEDATGRQTPNAINPNVPQPSPTALTGFSWNLLGSPISTSPRTTVGPYTVPGVYTYVAVYTNVCGTFYDTVFVTATNTVPVKLLSFTGRTISTDAMLSWQTASEKNTSHFDVYASVDGISFNPVGRIKAAGNSNQVLSYSFVDAGVFTKNQQMYYKLKMTDKDGTFEWSNVIELNTDRIMTKPVVNPNPFNSSLTVTLSDRTPAVITLTNLIGENVFTTTIDSGVQEITLDQVAGLKAGIYFISVTQHGVTTVSKLVKN